MDLKRIRGAIEKAGLKHKKLAGRIGVHPGTFSRFMTGKTMLHKSALILLCQILELDDLLEDLLNEAS